MSILKEISLAVLNLLKGYPLEVYFKSVLNA